MALSRAEYLKQWYKNNKEHKRAGERRRYALDPTKAKKKHDRWVKDNPEKLFVYQILRKYHLTFERFHEILIKQSGRCAACFSPMHNPYIDHDHFCCSGERSCGQCIRGLLCQHCNTALGYVKDDVNILKGLIAYLGESCDSSNNLESTSRPSGRL